MLKKTLAALSVATLSTAAAVLPPAAARAEGIPLQLAAGNPCSPCAAANPCSPCAAVKKPANPCSAGNPCAPTNPCAPSNPCAAANPCAPANPCSPGAAPAN